MLLPLSYLDSIIMKKESLLAWILINLNSRCKSWLFYESKLFDKEKQEFQKTFF